MIRIKRRTGYKQRQERGAILAVAAIGMVSVILAAGLAIDISHFYTAGTELQNAADSAALAGASALNRQSNGIVAATDRAVLTMNKYDVGGTNVTIARTDVKFGVNLTDLNGAGGLTEAQASSSPQNIRFVKVNVPPKAVGVSFSATVIGSSVNMARSAVAGQSVAINNFNYYSKLVLVQDDNPTRVANDTNEKLDVFGSCANDDTYTQGCTYNIHLAPPCDAHANRYEIIKQTNDSFPSSEINKQVLCPVDRQVSCTWSGDNIVIDSHINAQYIRQAFNSMFDVYAGGLAPGVFPPDTNVAQNITYAQYKSGSGAQAPSNAGMVDRRILVMPIMNLEQVANWDPNNFQVQYTKFGVFFLTKKPSGNGAATADLRVEYIGDTVVVGGGSFDPALCNPGPGTTQQVTVPVLYK